MLDAPEKVQEALSKEVPHLAPGLHVRLPHRTTWRIALCEMPIPEREGIWLRRSRYQQLVVYCIPDKPWWHALADGESLGIWLLANDLEVIK